jgi:hypothetical protein
LQKGTENGNKPEKKELKNAAYPEVGIKTKCPPALCRRLDEL